MFDLGSFALSDMVACSSGLRQTAAGAATMEEGAAALIRFLRQSFRDPATGEPSLALARLFKTERYDQLPADLQEFAARRLPPEVAPAPELRCLTLLATEGTEAAWCDPRASRDHRAIPLPSPQARASAPLISTLLSHLDGTADSHPAATTAPGSFDVFHVPEAAGSERIPAQDFVAGHGIRSVLGFGAMLPDGDAFAVVLFSRTPIPAATAELFGTVAVSAKLALLPLLEAPLFRGQPARPEYGSTQDRIATLEQLLAVQESTARGQALQLEGALRRLGEQDRQLRAEAEIVDTLREVARAVSAELDLDRLVQLATDAATRLTGAAFGSFFYNVIDERGESYMLYTLSGVPREAFERFPMPRSTAVFGPIYHGTAIVRSGNIRLDPRYGHNPPYHGMPEGHLPVCSYLGVPVVSRSGEVLGGLFFGHPDQDVFDERDEQLVVGIAEQAAAAIDNARRYRQQRDAALALQRSLLPQEVPEVEGLRIAHRYLPGAKNTEVGGDWFDVIPLSAGRTALVIGDVMGRGLHAAAVMGQLRTAVRAYAVMDLPPADVMQHLNELVCAMEVDHIATCIYAVHDPGERSIRFANAGHLPPLVRRADGQVSYLAEQPDAPLGVLLEAHHFREREVEFRPGMELILYTDGLVERRTEPLSAGLDRLREIVATVTDDPDPLCEAILKALTAAGEHDDDVALLAVRALAASLPQQVTRTWPPQLTAAAEARRFTAEAVTRWRLPGGPDDIVAVVDELVANAVEHAQSPVEVRLRRASRTVVLEVRDRDGRLPRLSPAAPGDERHRGMLIVARLASRWGARSTATGKVVWAEFDAEE